MKEITLSLAVSAEMAARIIALLNASTPESTPTPAPVQAPVQAPTVTPPAPAAAPPAPLPTTPVPPATTAAPPTAKFPALEEVRAKGLEAARTHGQPAIKAILNEFGVSGMTALAESDRAAFLVKLEGLGGGNA